MNTRSALVREVGFDTLDAAGAASNAAALRATGLTFAMVYVERATVAFVAKLLQADLAVSFLSEARTSGWSVSTGAADGKLAAERLLALGVPPAVSLGCDMEGSVPDETTAVAYANAWYAAARAAGLAPDAPDLYVGEGSGFVTPAALYSVGFRRYHRSMSEVPNVSERGYCCLQLSPGDQECAGVEVDYDVMQVDDLGGTLTLLTT